LVVPDSLEASDILNMSDAPKASDIKSYKPVSRILSGAIIYLSRQLLSGINLPTLYLGRAALKAVLYVAFQHARFTRP